MSTVNRNYFNRAFVSNPPGAYAYICASDFGSIQAALPSITANSDADYYAHVPNTGSQWKIGKTVSYMLPSGVDQTAGIILVQVQPVAPVYPGVNTVVATGAVMVLNGYAFKATTGGTTAAAFIGFSKFNTTAGATTTDGTVTWTCYGKAIWLEFQFENVTAGALTPAAMDFELFQQ